MPRFARDDSGADLGDFCYERQYFSPGSGVKAILRETPRAGVPAPLSGMYVGCPAAAGG